ncbi:MAG: hypothetical protein DBX55_09285 [Verrucomicrobia bacterium]|nr:MAG: hypothetical protein DBX55_09285 [Verrucomicrobiota bacterium]
MAIAKVAKIICPFQLRKRNLRRARNSFELKSKQNAQSAALFLTAPGFAAYLPRYFHFQKYINAAVDSLKSRRMKISWAINVLADFHICAQAVFLPCAIRLFLETAPSESRGVYWRKKQRYRAARKIAHFARNGKMRLERRGKYAR